MTKILYLFTFIILTSRCKQVKENKDQTQKSEKQLEWLMFGEIKPQGWIKAKMDYDLEVGFVGHLDELVPDLIIEDDIYGTDRLTKKEKTKNVGTALNSEGWAVELLWWNSETQSNWWDGYIRHAILLGNEKALKKAEKYIKNKLETQDTDGYLGIYAEDLRYTQKIENGELWAQASLMRGLLAWYEATKDKNILNAIEKAVQKTMQAYPAYQSEPFNVKGSQSGVGHGLMFTDILDWLNQLTGNKEYLDYALFLYKDYNKYDLRDEDIQLDNLNNNNYFFKGHAAHTMEHLRALTLTAFYSHDSIILEALDNYLIKLGKIICPSGGPIGDEFILGRTTNSDSVGYEYCSLQELMDSYSNLLQKTGDNKWSNKMEWLLYNAAQGAWHPHESSISYCKSDNSYNMLGELLNPDKNHVENRYKYSPTHQDVAVCCAPNAGRIYPYFVKAMWLRSKKGLVANLFGPSELNTLVNEKKFKITQETSYPFDFTVNFLIECEQENTFEIAIRKPAWAKSSNIKTDAKITEDEQYFYLNKDWKNGDNIQFTMDADVKVNTDLQNKKYISYGPLVFALKLDGKKIELKKYGNTTFRDLHYESVENGKAHLKLDPEAKYEVEKIKINNDFPWETYKIKTSFINPKTNEKEQVELYPIGSTILRKVSF